MSGFLIFLHAIACVLLVTVVMMQSGRGGGLTEAFASAESIFGAQTSGFLVKATTVLATIFLGISLSLAFLSSHKTQSLMTSQVKPEASTSESMPAKDKPRTAKNESSQDQPLAEDQTPEASALDTPTETSAETPAPQDAVPAEK